MEKYLKLIFVFLFAGITIQNQATVTNSESVYTQKFNDPEAYYFTPEN